MKVGVALEGLLVNVAEAFTIWQSRGGNASSYMDPKVVNDESFWASLKCQQNAEGLNSVDIYVLTERPPRLFLVTRSWLRREGIKVRDENIIMQSSGAIKRYDCRIHTLDYMIDSADTLTSFVYDRCIPIGIGDGFPSWIRSFPDLMSVRFEGDLRDWRILSE